MESISNINFRKSLGTLCFLLLLWAGTPNTANAQCPMCKAAIESNQGDKPDALASGLNKGILMLLAAPYMLAGAVVIAVKYHRRKARLAEQNAQ